MEELLPLRWADGRAEREAVATACQRRIERARRTSRRRLTGTVVIAAPAIRSRSRRGWRLGSNEHKRTVLVFGAGGCAYV